MSTETSLLQWILDYVAKHADTYEGNNKLTVGGNKLWQKMERDGDNPGHSWHSLRYQRRLSINP